MSSGREILTVAQMTAADRAAIGAGAAGGLLMERAGAGVAQTILARWTRRRVTVLCGPGNNGGDGYVIARTLAQAGWPVRTASMARAHLGGDAAVAAGSWTGPDGPLNVSAIEDAELIVDALFGAGLARPLAGEARAVLEAAERAGVPIVAVDLPSGLPGDAPGPLDYAPRCALTVTFHRKKPAHVLEPARGYCGDIVVVDIGLDAPGPEVALFENGPELWLADFPWPAEDAHKHDRGGLLVVSGHMTHSGAARLAARAGLRIGAGLVTVASPPDAVLVNAAHLEAVMLTAFAGPAELALAAERAKAAVVGPAAGVNEATAENVLALAEADLSVVVDADGLTVFKDDPERLFGALEARDVLTPHPGEFERIFPGLLKESPDRVAAARGAAKRAGAVVLLKGPDTVIAAPDGRAVVNTNGSPWLATAGSGDVLAGFIGGLLAQGMDSFQAACAGAWIHAACASAYGPGLIAEDLPDLSTWVLGELWARR